MQSDICVRVNAMLIMYRSCAVLRWVTRSYDTALVHKDNIHAKIVSCMDSILVNWHNVHQRLYQRNKCVYGVHVCMVCMCVWCACVYGVRVSMCVWCACVYGVHVCMVCMCVWCACVYGVRVCMCVWCACVYGVHVCMVCMCVWCACVYLHMLQFKISVKMHLEFLYFWICGKY